MKRLVLLSMLALPAAAHDFWIEPSTFNPAAGSRLAVSLRVGEHFAGEPVPRRPSRIESFVVRSESGERAIPGIENRDPAGVVTLGGDAGVATISYRGNYASLELQRKKFEAYLKEEGVTGLKVGDGIQRERYRRFSKSLLRIGNVTGIPEPLGERYELVVLSDPWTATPLRLRAVFDSRPIPNLLIAALSRDGKTLSARTDRDGLVTLAVTRGVWLVKAVRITPASADSGFDWESNWMSLTFER